MDIKQQFTTVTRFSKFVALLMLVLLPFIGFCAGIKFQAPIIVVPSFTPKVSSIPTSNPKQQEPVACTQEAKVCPDGSSVGRTGPNCEFASCPISQNKNKDVTIGSGLCGPCGDVCINHAEAASCPMLDGSFKCERINAVCTKILLSR